MIDQRDVSGASSRWRGLVVLLLIAMVGAIVFFNLKRHSAGDAGRTEKIIAPDGPSWTIDLGQGVSMELVRIPAGPFAMGSPETEADRDRSEGPVHQVTISRPIYVGKFEVTQRQWQAVMNSNQANFKGDASLPEEQVSWGDCQKFCQALSAKTGLKIRLPSEAEWEYACRAGAQSATAFGETLSSTAANFNGTTPYNGGAAGPNLGKTSVAGSYQPNAFGLFDMHGNVAEWCQDVFHDDYTGAPADGSAWMIGGNDAKTHCYRGGAYSNDGSNCRSAVRFAADQDLRTSTIGFRVVCTGTGQ